MQCSHHCPEGGAQAPARAGGSDLFAEEALWALWGLLWLGPGGGAARGEALLPGWMDGEAGIKQ